MHLELMRDGQKKFPEAGQALAVQSLCVWHCKYKTLESVAQFKNLQSLKIATFPDQSFAALTSLSKLEWLSVTHLPRVEDLEAIGEIRGLQFLELKTLPSWDSSRKKTIIKTLQPLSKLPKLKHISLFGVIPKDLSLAPLEQCARLRSARFQGYPASEVERFYQVSGAKNEQMPESALQ